MSYTTYDFSETIAGCGIQREDIARVEAAWGKNGYMSRWDGGFVLRMKDGKRLIVLSGRHLSEEQERAMDKQFTASEVRKKEIWLYDAVVRKMLHAFADLLEARGNAVPVCVIGDCAEVKWLQGGPCQLPPETYLYTHPAPADAERLAEALLELADRWEQHDYDASRARNAAGHDHAMELRQMIAAQAQPPAASVPEALRLLQSVLCDTDGNCCIRGTYEDRRTVDKALAMLAAQENPNG